MSYSIKSSLHSKIIQDVQHLESAWTLLGRVYHDELGWTPASDNPSHQRIVRLPSGQTALRDKFDASSVWVGVFDEDEIVGCLRIIDPEHNEGRRELDAYFSLPRWISSSPGRIVEVNRLALAQSVRGGPGALLLLLEVLRFTQRNKCSVVASAIPSVARFVVRWGGMSDTGLSFKYHPRDPEPVSVLLWLDDDGRCAQQINSLERKLDRLMSRRPPHTPPCQDRAIYREDRRTSRAVHVARAPKYD